MSEACALGVTHRPDRFLGDGWIRAERKIPGQRARCVEATSTGPLEVWTGAEPARLHLRLPAAENPPRHLALNLRSCWAESGGSALELRVAVNGATAGVRSVPNDIARTFLFDLPAGLLVPGELAVVELQALETRRDQGELEGLPPGRGLGIELSALRLHADLDAVLAEVQALFDEASRQRDELFDRGSLELWDKGELHHVARTTLARLDSFDDSCATLRARLLEVIEDPHVRARSPQRCVFDRDYFRSHERELREGRIHAELRRWSAGLEAYRRGVIDACNRSYLLLGDDPEGPLADQLPELPPERLLELKEKNQYLNDLEILLGRDELQSFPSDLEIEMTSYCNYACVMCGRSYLTFAFTRQDDAQMAQLVPILPYVSHVTIAGVGENTMSGKIGLLAKMLERFRCDSRLFTNGSFIDRKLDAVRRFRKVCVSFDGGTAETFQTQRRGANFRRVVENVRLLRASAPELVLAFSVVVSRLNLDELAEIARLAAELGVNHVALSPMWDRSELHLKASDRPLFERVLAEARALAASAGVTIQNNVQPSDFEAEGDVPLDKPALLAHARALEFPSHRVPSAASILERFESLHFEYYPRAELFPDRRTPEARAVPEAPESATPPLRDPLAFDLEAAHADLDRKVAEAERELAARPRSELRSPYCLSVWKYTYTKANGKNRLCPQRNVAVGDVLALGFRGVANSEMNRWYRRHLFDREQLHPLCFACTDPYRWWGRDHFRATLEKLGLDLPDRTSVVHALEAPSPLATSCSSGAHGD
ncbi:MAG: radical SAM protein [Planctomycetes bacterium]|nr:radical SAM protein [Planctomycetota bacterium]